MNIQINKDFLTEYKNDFWKGFSFTELVYIGTSFVIGAIATTVVYFAFNVPVNNAIYLAVPFALPTTVMGFFKYQGYMPVKRLISEIRFTNACSELNFESCEEDKTRREFRIKKCDELRHKTERRL